MEAAAVVGRVQAHREMTYQVAPADHQGLGVVGMAAVEVEAAEGPTVADQADPAAQGLGVGQWETMECQGSATTMKM